MAANEHHIHHEYDRPKPYDEQVAELSWEALLSAGAIKEASYENPFIFASGEKATIKVDAEVLDKSFREREILLGKMAMHPCMDDADVLLYVPDGMRNFTNILGHEMGLLVAQTKRVDGGGRYDFNFIDHSDKDLALGAKHPRIIEDVVTSLGSVAGIARLLDDRQDIHSLAILQRGAVNPLHQKNLIDHYLIKRFIPNDKAEFYAGLNSNEKELIMLSRA